MHLVGRLVLGGPASPDLGRDAGQGRHWRCNPSDAIRVVICSRLLGLPEGQRHVLVILTLSLVALALSACSGEVVPESRIRVWTRLPHWEPFAAGTFAGALLVGLGGQVPRCQRPKAACPVVRACLQPTLLTMR